MTPTPTPTLTQTPDQTNPLALLLSPSALPDGAEPGLAGGLRPDDGAFTGLFQTVLTATGEAGRETARPAGETGANADPSEPSEDSRPTPEMPMAELTLWLGDLARGAVQPQSLLAQGSVGETLAPSSPHLAAALLPQSDGQDLAAAPAKPPVPAQSAVEARAQPMAEAPPTGMGSASAFADVGLSVGVDGRSQTPALAVKPEAGPVPFAPAASGILPLPLAPGQPVAALRPSAPAPILSSAVPEMVASQPLAEGKAKSRPMARDLPVDFRVILDTAARPHVPDATTARPPMPLAELREAGAAITAILGQTVEARPLADAPAEPQASPLAPGQPERLETENPEWIADLADRILAKLTEDGATIELALTPERLGPLEVRLDLRDSRAEVSFRTETAEAARLLNEAQPRLADLMAQSGFNLANQDTAPRDAPWRLRRDAVGPAAPDATPGPEAPSSPGYGHSGQLNLIA